MPAKSVVMAIVLSGWLIAAVFAALVVAYASFFGVARHRAHDLVRLHAGRTGGGWPRRQRLGGQPLRAAASGAQRDVGGEQRAAVRHKHSLAVKSVRFFKHLGMALTAIGFGGFLYYQV